TATRRARCPRVARVLDLAPSVPPQTRSGRCAPLPRIARHWHGAHGCRPPRGALAPGEPPATVGQATSCPGRAGCAPATGDLVDPSALPSSLRGLGGGRPAGALVVHERGCPDDGGLRRDTRETHRRGGSAADHDPARPCRTQDRVEN